MFKKIFKKSLVGVICLTAIWSSFAMGVTQTATKAEDCSSQRDYSLPMAAAEHTNGTNAWTSESDFFTDKEPVTDYAYSFAVIGDQQNVNNWTDNLHYIYDYILDNKDAKKIEYVFNVGDITENSTEREWENAMAQFNRLDGVIPYSAVRGNHDSTTTYEGYLGASEAYKNQFEGFYVEGKVQNSWRTLTVGETDYLIMNLGYAASDAVLNWAGQVVSRFPDHKVIVTTHGYMSVPSVSEEAIHYGEIVGSPGVFQSARDEYNYGIGIWEKFISRYENIFLVLCGHVDSSVVKVTKSTGIHGNKVIQIINNFQWEDMIYKDTGCMGNVTMLYFSEDGTKIDVENYATIRQAYYKPENQFSISLVEETVEEETHTCEASEEWVKNATHHWNVCMGDGCSEELNKAEHTFGEWKETLAPTKDAEGRKERSCSTCNYTEATSVPKKTGGCSSFIGGLGLGAGIVALLGSAVCITKKKIKK